MLFKREKQAMEFPVDYLASLPLGGWGLCFGFHFGGRLRSGFDLSLRLRAGPRRGRLCGLLREERPGRSCTCIGRGNVVRAPSLARVSRDKDSEALGSSICMSLAG